MIESFFRYPHTPHLAWLGAAAPRDDKVLSVEEVRSLLSREVVVEEKLDGANLGVSLGAGGDLKFQNRGQYLEEPYSGQFARLQDWLSNHADKLWDCLTTDTILFGEWCAARHSLDYVALPDWFLLFDVYDRTAGSFWSVERRNALAKHAGIVTVPQLARGKFSVESLKSLVETSKSFYRPGPPEGIVVRRDSPELSEARAKLVRGDFVQSIESHWRKRKIEWNRIVRHDGTN